MTMEGIAARFRGPDGRRFTAFLVTGCVAASINILSRIVFGLVLPYEAAVLVAFLVGLTTGFFLAKVFVFPSAGRGLLAEYGRFALVNLAALIQVFAVSVLLARGLFPAIGLLWNAELLAHVIAVLSPVLVSYQGHKRFSFA